MPVEEPTFRTKSDQSFVCVFTFHITENTRLQLSNLESAKPAVKLLNQWCAEAPRDAKFRGRFKTICKIDDIEKHSFLPSLMKSHNGKPVLINKSGQLTICEDKSYEMRINVHKFAFLARKILFSLQPNFKRLSINVGFTIEGRHDRELPECLLGCANLSNFDHQKFL